MRRPFLVLVILAALSGCRSREKHLREGIASAARSGILNRDVRVALCGFDPHPKIAFQVEALSFTFEAEEKGKGPGEMTATFVAGSGFRCKGRTAFVVEYHEKSGKHRAHWQVRERRRVGDPPEVLSAIEEHAKPLGIDAPATAAFDASWTLPDGSPAVAYRLDVEEPGLYRVAFEERFPMHEDPREAFYQGRDLLPEGDGTGKLQVWKLEPGAVLAVIAVDEPRTLALRIRPFEGLGKSAPLPP